MKETNFCFDVTPLCLVQRSEVTNFPTICSTPLVVGSGRVTSNYCFVILQYVFVFSFRCFVKVTEILIQLRSEDMLKRILNSN